MFKFMKKLRSNSPVNSINPPQQDVQNQLRRLAEDRARQVERMPGAGRNIQEMIDQNNRMLGE